MSHVSALALVLLVLPVMASVRVGGPGPEARRPAVSCSAPYGSLEEREGKRWTHCSL